MENSWSELQAHGIEVVETEVTNDEFEILFGDLEMATHDEDGSN
jgi:hypothetical protein